MHFRAIRIFYVLALISLSSTTLLAQRDRIAGPVNREQMVALKGNIHPNADLQSDDGPVDPSLKLDQVMLMLENSPTQQAALDQLLANQQNPSSPDYHAWLTPEQYADRFGLSPNDIAKIASWLQSEGLNVNQTSRGRNWISFTGTAGQIGGVLKTEIRRYRVGGELHYANASEPSVPAAIAPFVLGVLGLDDFRPPARAKARRSVRPQFTDSTGEHSLAPGDFATIYNLAKLYSLGYDGTGQKIAVAGQSAIDLLDIQVFRLLYGLPKNDPQIILAYGAPDPGHVPLDEDEADLDVEWTGAVAPNARITYVYSPLVTFSLIYAIDQNLAPVISYSYGDCEGRQTNVVMQSFRAVAQEANVQGITLVVPSGDAGAADCDASFDPTKPTANRGLAVEFPASLPEVTGAGGTQFDDAVGHYWNSANASNFASALSYIPEKAWNESDDQGLAASGGGLSAVFAKPLWQTGPGVPDGNFRAVPDVSLSAAAHDGYLVVGGGVPFVESGTSTATPTFAGILALVNQYMQVNGAQTRSGLGNINPTLYSLAQNTAGVFHDITSGNNVVPCLAGTKDCVAGKLGYAAGPGYDLVTGLGSVDGFNLAVNFAKQWVTPAIALVSPNSVIAGGGGFTLVVSGSGFDAGSVVQWMGNPLPTTFVSGTQLLATVSSTLIASQGSITITVLTSRGVSAPASLVIVPFSGFVITDQKVTNAVSPSGCGIPTAKTTFLITDSVFLFFQAKTTSNNLLSYDFIGPDGALELAGSYSPATGFFCFPTAFGSLNDLGFNPLGNWQARIFDHGNLIVSIPFSVTVAGNQTIPLAHAADGNGFKTTVLLTNTGKDTAPYTLRFNDDHGNVPSTRFELDAGLLTGVIPPGESVTIRTAGLGTAIVNGWAELTAPPSVGGSVIYSQKTGLPSIQEGTSTIVTTGSQHFFLPFDNTAGAITGVALTDPSATAANNISITFRYDDGTSEAASYPPLASRNHKAFAISTQFPHTANRSGVAEFTSDAPLSVVAFRFNSTGAFTAFDATPAGAAGTIVTRPLSHAADGNGFKTTVLLTNAGAAAAPYTLRFNDDQGNLPLTGFNLEAGSLTGNIPAGGSVTIRTAGLGSAIVNGWAELTAAPSVGGSVIFSQKTALPSIQEGTSTIVASGSKHFFLPFDNTAGAITGVAITNPGALAAKNISITFRYSNGSSEVLTYPQLASRNHQAFALAAQFPDTLNQSGVAEFTSDVALSVVAFRFNSTGAFTSFGVVAP